MVGPRSGVGSGGGTITTTAASSGEAAAGMAIDGVAYYTAMRAVPRHRFPLKRGVRQQRRPHAQLLFPSSKLSLYV